MMIAPRCRCTLVSAQWPDYNDILASVTPGLSTETLVIVILVPILSLVFLTFSGIMFWIFCRRRNSDKVISERWMNHCTDKVERRRLWLTSFTHLMKRFWTIKYRSIYLVNTIYFYRKLREKLDKFKQRKLESQREMSISTVDSGNKEAGEAGDFQERYIM